MRLFVVWIFYLLFVSGCNPFARNSLVNIIFQPEVELKNQKSQIQILSGGTKNYNAITFSSQQSLPEHFVEVSVGTTIQQLRLVTNKGDIVELSTGGVQR